MLFPKIIKKSLLFFKIKSWNLIIIAPTVKQFFQEAKISINSRKVPSEATVVPRGQQMRLVWTMTSESLIQLRAALQWPVVGLAALSPIVALEI